jgi:hypothetical protein
VKAAVEFTQNPTTGLFARALHVGLLRCEELKERCERRADLQRTAEAAGLISGNQVLAPQHDGGEDPLPGGPP